MNTPAQMLPADWSLPGCPCPPHWALDWPGLLARYRWLKPLQECPQNPEFHAEGDVLTHCRMVCEALSRMPAWQALSEPARGVLFAAALLHDIGKPLCTVVEPDGRISSRGHTRKGAQIARGILYREGLAEAGPPPFAVRESIVALVRAHAKPMQFLSDDDSRHTLLETSLRVPCSWVALLAEADALGRTSTNTASMVENVSLYRESAGELGCLDAPWPFPSNHSRFHYFRHQGGDPYREVYDDTSTRVILMSGLPGAGKDTWIARQSTDLPVISLDRTREEMGVSPDEEQGTVAAQATERARSYLRKRQPFIWNATNISHRMRGKLIRLFTGYGASTRVVYVETDYETLLRRNRQRERQLPPKAIEQLIEKWEVPDLTEAQLVDVAVDEAFRG